MKKCITALQTPKSILLISGMFFTIIISGCKEEMATDLRTKEMDSAQVVKLAASIESTVKPELAENLTLRLWGIDSLVVSPIAIDIDDHGKLYYATTNRQKNSEFDIRGHREWEIESIALQTVEDKRSFLHRILAPEKSKQNEWLKDLNGDSSHDWKDMTVEKENIFRIEDRNGDGVADFSQLVVDDFNDEVTDVAGGVMSDGDDLFVAVAPDLWRIKDKNGDGVADEKTSISHGYGIHIGFGGHGMSGIEMGPDGKIYWQIGDIGFNGKGPDGQKWEYPNSGVIARANPDGSDFEIFAAGLRNTHEFVFDEYGNLISEDNDGDHPGEKERLVYVVNGSDAGWRSNWQYGKYRDPQNNTYKVWMDEKMYLPRFEGQAAYITPCISNFESGPAGVVYNPGTALGPEYKNTFFVAEFVGNPSNSGIHGFKLKPKGATFELVEHKQVLSGILATGLDFGPDGALYVADWIDGWDTHPYGRIWKLDHKDAASNAERKKTKTLLAANFKDRKVEELGEILKNPDMRVRQKAQFELVKREEDGAEIFSKSLKQTSHQFARIHAIWGISQLARKDEKHAALLIPYLKDGDAEIRAQAAKWLGDIRYKKAGDHLIPLLKDTNSRARFFAAEALGRMQHAAAITPIINFLRDNNDQDAYLRHAGSLALARIGKAEPVIALSVDSSRALRIAAVVALRRMSNPGITKFLSDRDEFVVTETARAINDDLSIKDALPALASLLNTTSFTNEALLRRIISANMRVGNDQTMQNLLNFSKKEGAPSKMRAEAIEALSTWSKPSVLDRVDGRYRGPVERDPSLVRNKVTSDFFQLLNNKDSAVRINAVKAISKLNLKQAAPQLLALLKTDREPDVRVAALTALVALEAEQVADGVKLAIGDKEKKVRVAGLSLLQKMNIPKDLMVNLLTDVINTKTIEEKQAAILTLGKLPIENSKKVFDDLLNKMSAGKLAPDLYFELGEALDSTGSGELVTRYKNTAAKLSPDEVTAAYAGTLSGGDAERGRTIFFRNQSAQCMKCHAYDDRGGNAGPRLNGVAARLNRSEILEALISPGKRLAPGFGVVTLTLKKGNTVSGVLQAENEKSITIKVTALQNEVVAKADIAKRENAPSSMPDMKAILSKKEIRDVVSFLSTLKENN